MSRLWIILPFGRHDSSFTTPCALSHPIICSVFDTSRCNAERSHSFSHSRSGRHSQSLRLRGHPWEYTQSFRERLPPLRLVRFPTFHVRMLSVIDEHVINCWRKTCGLNVGGCSHWTIESAIRLQRQLGEQLDDVLSGRSTFYDTRPGGSVGETRRVWSRESRG